MSIKRKILIVTAIGATIGMSSCKKYLDVNKDPNVLNNPTVQVLLPTTELYIASELGSDLEVNGSIWAQYWTQNPNSSQYRNLEQYQPTSDTYEYPWTNLYAAGENLLQLDKLAVAQSRKQYRAIDLLLRAYTFQLITDGWGDVPFSEALKGQGTDGGIVSPHYDMQKLIYAGILNYIKQADSLINPADPAPPGADDIIYGGDMTKWQKFANTLQLRMLLRLSRVDPGTAQAGIAALYATNPTFIGTGDDAQINYLNAAGNKNPLYTTEVQLMNAQNLVGSKTCIDTMNANNDYRLYAFYEPVAAGFVGITQGLYSQPANPGTYSIPSPYVAGDANNTASATAPVKFLTSYESYFLQAEASARGWGSAGMDSSLFYQGIQASFQSYSAAFNTQAIALDTNGHLLTSDYGYFAYVNGDTLAGAPAAYWSQYPASGSITQKLRFIITQKWFSMCGNQGFEAWTEWRRTGYPDFFIISKNALGNQFPRRFLYPTSELTRNANFPGVQPVTAKVYWDTH